MYLETKCNDKLNNICRRDIQNENNFRRINTGNGVIRLKFMRMNLGKLLPIRIAIVIFCSFVIAFIYCNCILISLHNIWFLAQQSSSNLYVKYLLLLAYYVIKNNFFCLHLAHWKVTPFYEYFWHSNVIAHQKN